MSAEVKPVAGSTERTKGLFFGFHHQWDSFTPGCNWRDFTLLHLGGEWSEMTGRVEFSVTVLGVSVELTYVYNDDFVREMMGRRDDFLSCDGPELERRQKLYDSTH